jgi:CDP-2,3-bis-(O-geranylgeranyl)-sn-glycerol synthase
MGVKSGKSIPILDQVTFLAFALIFVIPYFPAGLDLINVIILFVITYFVHYLSNMIAYKLKLKSVPWKFLKIKEHKKLFKVWSIYSL